MKKKIKTGILFCTLTLLLAGMVACKKNEFVPFDGNVDSYVYNYADFMDAPQKEWEEDIIYAVDVLMKNHPSLVNANSYVYEDSKRSLENFYDEALHQQFIEDVNALLKNLPNYNEAQMEFELQRIFATLNDGHTAFLADVGENMPIGFELFYENGEPMYYVYMVPKGEEHLLFSKLEAIDGIRVEALIERMKPYVSAEGNALKEALLPVYFRSKESLQAIGVMGLENDQVRYTLRLPDGSTNIITLEAYNQTEYEEVSRVSKSLKKLQIGRFKHPESIYWHEFWENENIVYAHVSQCEQDESYPFGKFCGEIMELLAEDESRELIFDLRGNSGGIYPLDRFEELVEFLK